MKTWKQKSLEHPQTLSGSAILDADRFFVNEP
jgi:hypothetical protein